MAPAKCATLDLMKEGYSEQQRLEEAKARELAWIKEHVTAFWSTAYAGYYDEGRGAVVIDTTVEPLGEDTPFYYVQHARFTDREDDVSRQVATLVTEYDPQEQFVAVFIRPGGEEQEFSIFQIRVADALAQAAQAYGVPEPGGEEPLPAELSVEPEPPDLETLLAWEEEGGCEATDGCWVEPDGVCSHGHPSWLLELGLI